ncbi:autotransporter family porin [Pseudomonas antarctica]|uniref:Autotransporter family porin n=1 Tax=Pseudomonas antarctica TaxID=219572 RepID=A0A1H0CDK6_9PSED|nr:autotransporter outer membrane beta-barrel domain-containing protein [Pseudomonas antarctica]SDN55974.1 autotransporter family porin [Pseudomonas antarctica]
MMNFKSKTTLPRNIPLAAMRNTSPSEFNFIKTALAVALISPATFLFSGYAYAACPADSSSGVNVTSGETCTAALSTYQTNDVFLLKTYGIGSVLNITAPAVQLTQGGLQASHGAVYSEMGGVINVQGALDIFAVGTGSYNTGVSAHHDGSIVNLGSNTTIVHHGNNIGGAGISAQFGNALITAAGPVSITTDGAAAILSTEGSTISLKDINLTVGSNGNPNPNGIFVTDAGSSVSYASGVMNTSGTAIRVLNGGAVSASGSTELTTTLNQAQGISVDGPASSGTFNGSTSITTSGAEAHGAGAGNQGTIKLLGGGAINTAGQQAYGLFADAAGSQITMQGGSINTTGLQGSGVLAQNAGQAALVGTSVTTQGDAAQGLQALSGGTVDATGVSVLTSGGSSRGLYSDGAGSAIRFYGGTVATNNTNSNGIFITNEGTVALRRDTNGIGSVINTGGAAPSVLIGFGSPTGSGSFDADGATVTAANGSAIYAQGSGSSVLVNDSTLNGATGAVALIQGAKATVTDSVLKSSADSTGHAIQVSSASAFTGTGLDISTTGQGGRGVSATGVGSTVSLGSSKISTTGENGAYGLFAEDSANVIATGLDINTTGLNSHGAFALTGAAIDVSNSTVFTSGDSANGLVASGAGSAIKANNTTLNTSGQQAYGALADQGKIDMVNSTLFTTGQNSNAINAFNSGIVNVTGSSILTSGQGSTGIKVLDDSALGSTVNLFSTQVRTEGTDAWAADVKGTLNMQGGTLSSASYGAMLASGDATINLENSAQVVGGNGTLLSIASENSLVNLTLDNNVYAQGNITFANPSNVDALLNSRTKVSLLNSSSWTGSTNAIDSLSLDLTSKWMVTGDSKLNRLDNSGSIYVGGALGTTVTVNDTYTSNGGLLSLKTQLGNDSSPTDKLVAGKVVLGSGATRLEVNNVNGLGALTTGDGIEVVHVNDASASAAGAFALGNRVAAGAYEYTLQQNGLAGSDGNWYLRSTTNVTPPVVDPVTRPNYRPEVPLNMALPALTNRFSLAMLGTYHDRRAESSANEKDTTVKPTTWGRVLAEKGSAGKSGYGAFMDQGSSYDYDIKGFQVGQDLYGAKNPNGTTDVAGIYVGRGDISGNVDAVNGGRAGSASMDATSLGAYWTRKGENGWYVDSVLQGTVYSDVKTNSGEGEKLRTKGRGMTASVEGGYPIALGNNWAVEPQAQLIYQQISLDRDQDTFGKVKFDDTKTGYARVGSRLTKQLNLNSDQPATVWARANVWQQIGPDSRTTFTNLQGSNAVSLDTRLGGTWAQIGVGVTGKVTESISAFVGTDYNQTMGSGDGHSISGRVGLEVTW